jgi:hypothetical protein
LGKNPYNHKTNRHQISFHFHVGSRLLLRVTRPQLPLKSKSQLPWGAEVHGDILPALRRMATFLKPLPVILPPFLADAASAGFAA